MPTASKPADPARTLETIDALGESIASFASREQALKVDHDAQLVVVRRKWKSMLEEAEAGFARQRAGLEQSQREERERLEAFHEARLERIDDRLHSSRRHLTERITRERDERVGKLQATILKSKEERRAEWQAARGEQEVLGEGLSADRARVGAIEGAALKSMRAFKPWCAGRILGRKGGGEVDAGGDARELHAAAGEAIERAGEAVHALATVPMPQVFRWIPFWLWVAGVIAAVAFLHPAGAAAFRDWLPGAGAAVGVVMLLYGIAWATAQGALGRVVDSLREARSLLDASQQREAERVEGLRAAIKEESAEQSGELSAVLRAGDQDSQERIRAGHLKLEEQVRRLPPMEEKLHAGRLRRCERRQAARTGALEAEIAARREAIDGEHEEALREVESMHQSALDELAGSWPEQVAARLEELAAAARRVREDFPAWSGEQVEAWEPPGSITPVVPFGWLELDPRGLVEAMPRDDRFVLGGAMEVPLGLSFPLRGSLMLEGDAAEAASAFNEIVLRLLAGSPVGRVAFTLIDPVGLGRDFAGLMHLADYEDNLIHGRIWTQQAQIEERLGELNEHLEKVIQMYLRNEFETITEYNEQAGSIAEKYQFVVIAGLPNHFSEVAMARLRSIAASGARCGVFLLVHREPGKAVDPSLDEELRRNCLCLKQEGGAWVVEGNPAGASRVRLVEAPDDALESRLVHRFGRASIDSNRIEVPFSEIAPEGGLWEVVTGDELRVPIGRTGARKLQELAIGKGTRQHVLVAGKTGSGKSTLFHVMITNLALHCSPEEVEFYLVDFKKGVEFKCYGTKRLPHARVVAIESDREFGLSVLHRVDEELRRRGEMFRKVGAQDVAGYRRATGETLPRTLLLIDEFQEFFTEDDGVGQEASLLLDRIVRQGRAFGVHAILGSQTLGGAYTLARATLGQMVIRIALQCNEADAYLIMDDDNPAPRLLTRPGEGIYNDNAGALAANSPFQTVWLSEADRDRELERVAAEARDRGMSMPAPVVFEGNAPADLRDNDELAAARAEAPGGCPGTVRAWLGAPNSIKGPTAAPFRRQSGSNLLLVGQGEERMNAMMAAAMVSIAAQCPREQLSFVVLDPAGEDGHLARWLKALGVEGEIHVPGDLDEVMGRLAGRLESGGGGRVFLLVRELHRFKPLKQDDEFRFSMDDDAAASPAATFLELASEGPQAGIHLVAGVDTWSNVQRFIPRKSMSDFQLRVLFQMSANDSTSLIDSPAAGKLGLHRAILHDEAMGSLETFRPYALLEPGELG